MLDKIKLDLRIGHDLMDSDIQGNIDACHLDLGMAGVNTTINDPLIEKAIKLYMRWQYNFENEGERYMKAYVNLKQALSLCGDYNV